MRAKIAQHILTGAGACVLLVSPTLLCQNATNSDLFRQALILFHDGRFEEAKVVTSKVLDQHPNEPFGLNLMGAILDKLNRFAESESYYQRAVALEPKSPAFLSNVGSHYLMWGKTELAKTYFLRAVRLQPRYYNANYELSRMAIQSGDGAAAFANIVRMDLHDRDRPEVILLKAQALFLQKQPQKARENLSRLENVAPNDPAVAFSAGMVYYRNELYKDAADMFSAATRLLPDDFEGQYNLGLACERLGRLKPAEQALTYAVRLRPDSSDAIYHLALVLSQENNVAEALGVLAGLPPAKETAEGLNLQARLYERVGKLKEALEDYQTAIRLAPTRELYYLDLIIFLINSHADEAAQKALQAARPIFPQSRKLALVEAISYATAGNPRQAYESLQEMEKHGPADALQATVTGLVASFMGDRKTAAAHMKRAIALGSVDPLPYYYLSLFESQAADPNLDLALLWAEEAIARDPQFAPGHLLRGELLVKLGRPAAALGNLQVASRLDPKSPEPHFLLGRVYQKLGKLEQADKEFRESERLRLQRSAAEIGGAERQLLVRIQSRP